MDTRAHQFLDNAFAVGSAARIEMNDAVHPDADTHQVRRQFVQVDESLVPGQEPQVAIKHGDALLGIVDRMLEEVAAVLDRRRGIIEELERRLCRNGAPPQEQRKREARRGGADGGCQ